MSVEKSRGGKREGSGRPPTWWAGKCKAVKIPEVIADQVLEVAREIDKRLAIQEFNPDMASKTPLEQVMEIRKLITLSEQGVTGYTSKKELIRELRKILIYDSRMKLPL